MTSHPQLNANGGRTSLTRGLAVLVFAAVLASPILAGPQPLALHHVALDLPGAPASIIPSDLDGDGRIDILVVMARTQWGEIGTDRIEGLVQVSEVVPALFDRREAQAFHRSGLGSYTPAADPFTIPPKVLSLEAGPPGYPVLALTNDGLSELKLVQPGNAATSGIWSPKGSGTPPEGSASGPETAQTAGTVPTDGEGGAVANGAPPSAPRAALELESIFDDRPVLADCQSLVPNLGLVRDVDGDGTPDIVFPSKSGLAFHMTSAGKIAPAPVARVVMPGDERWSGARAGRTYPLPRVEDLNGDGTPDLLLIDRGKGENARPVIEVVRGSGGGRFRSPVRIAIGDLLKAARSAATSNSDEGHKSDESDESDDSGDSNGEPADPPHLEYFGDLDGNGLAEAVIKVSLDKKSGLKQAKQPHFLYRFHHANKDLTLAKQPYQELKVTGHGFDAEFGEVRMREFQDLDGDGRKDLITVTLDFSVFQIIRVLATKRIGVGLDFHVWAQGADGVFRTVEGLDLSETVRFDLNDLKLERLAQFAGDFDGDGRSDFVHFGRGKDVTIHRGQPGCRYPAKPDLTIRLEEEPEDIGLVRVGDFDGDGRSDIAVTRPLPVEDAGASAPVRLDLYLSGGAR